MKEASFYTRQENSTVQCRLCPHNCIIEPKKTGICRVRKNEGGTLNSLAYGKITSLNLDPIEKKPLYHFYPGSMILSAGSFGCNFRCSFCQNWEISQAGFGDVPVRDLAPASALRTVKESNSIGLAYTYNEPLMNYEWLLETSKLLHKENLKNVLVTNGYINPEPLKELLPVIDAANIDLKSFSNRFYKKLCAGKLEPVLKTIETMVKSGKHVELTTLLIPGENDSSPEIVMLADWIAALDNRIPLHFSRYFPTYKMEVKPTGMDSLINAYALARKKLKYVYLVNVNEQEYNNTYCPSCGTAVIEREGYNVKHSGSKCSKCGASCDIINDDSDLWP